MLDGEGETLRIEETEDGLAFQEGPVRFELALDLGPERAILAAAYALVLLAADADGKVRAMELLREGGEVGLEVAGAILRRSLDGSRLQSRDRRQREHDHIHPRR